MSISTVGIGSGIDLTSLIGQLISAEGSAKANRLNINEAGYQGDISAFGSLKSALSLFQSGVQGLQDASDFQQRSASSSDSDVFTATADETADISQYGVEVVQLAQVHKLISTDSFASTDVVGSGTLTFAQGTDSFSLTVAATDTLTDIRDAINGHADNTGLTASIINVGDGTEQKIVFTANESGLENAITITADDDDDDDADALVGISRLINANLEEPSEALDGEIKVDGQLISSSTNVFNSVIDGISITAVDVGAGETLSITENRSAVTSKINTFIANYNGLVDTFNALGSFNAGTSTAGILLGDATLRGIQNSIRNEISSSVSGLTYGTLAELGIKTNDEGKLSVDNDVLHEALDDSFDDVGELFASTDGIANRLDSIVEGYIKADGIIETRTDGLQLSIDDITEQREALDRRLLSIESRLVSRFAALDQIVSTLRNQSDFLTQQLANLPGAYNPNKN